MENHDICTKNDSLQHVSTGQSCGQALFLPDISRTVRRRAFLTGTNPPKAYLVLSLFMDGAFEIVGRCVCKGGGSGPVMVSSHYWRQDEFALERGPLMKNHDICKKNDCLRRQDSSLYPLVNHVVKLLFLPDISRTVRRRAFLTGANPPTAYLVFVTFH